MIKPIFHPIVLSIIVFSISCQGKKEATKTADPTTTFTIKKDTAKPAQDGSPQRPPIVNISDTIAAKYIVLYIKDSAASSGRIGQKLGKIYGVTLPEFIKKNKLTISGSPMAWYKTTKAPFFFEAGIPINENPGKLPKGIFVKTVGGDKAVIAHFFGPYSVTNMGYEALADFLKDNKKKRNGTPYEIYVTEPIGKDGKAIDPYKVQTDIVYPYQ